MKRKNDGKGPDNEAQNRFSAYLLVALRNTRKMYLEKLNLVKLHELSFDWSGHTENLQYQPDMLDGLPPMDQLEDEHLQELLLQAAERDLYILLAKNVEGKSIREISAELGVCVSTVSSAYHRMVRRLRMELINDGYGF